MEENSLPGTFIGSVKHSIGTKLSDLLLPTAFTEDRAQSRELLSG